MQVALRTLQCSCTLTTTFCMTVGSMASAVAMCMSQRYQYHLTASTCALCVTSYASTFLNVHPNGRMRIHRRRVLFDIFQDRTRHFGRAAAFTRRWQPIQARQQQQQQ